MYRLAKMLFFITYTNNFFPFLFLPFFIISLYLFNAEYTFKVTELCLKEIIYYKIINTA